MKILMATMGLDIGGAETHIVELAKQMKTQGHDLIIVSHGGVYVPEIVAAGIRHYEAPLHRRSVKEMRQSTAILQDVITREKPDIVHAHARIPAFLCGRLARKMGFAFVTSCHGVYQVSRMLRVLSDWGERTLAVSEDIRDYLVEEYQVPVEHITLTINGIDTEKFSPAVSGRKLREELGLGSGLVLGHVSRLDKETALAASQLIEIAPEVDKIYPGVRMVLVGGGTAFEELKQKAQAVNQAMGRECLTLTGPRTDINQAVAACDLFVGVSRAALEAMAAEKPVILSGAQGHTGLFTPELLDKAVDTNFCCRTDPTATTKQMLDDVLAALALPKERKEQLGQYGRQVVKEHYSVERMAQDCLGVYEQVRRKKYHVLMSGYYGFSNAGDDAILESVKQAVEQASGDVELTVLSNDPELTWKQYGLASVDRFKLHHVFSALRKTDLLLFGGGSLLQDTTSTRSLLYYLSVIRGAQWLGKPVMLYANGIGPVRRGGNRSRVRKAVERAAVVTLRDHDSAQELKNMGVTTPELQVTADPVFHLTPAQPERARELLQSCGMPVGAQFVAVSVREWPRAEQFPEQLAQLCDYLRRSYGLEVLFLLMQPENDLGVTQRVRQAMEEPSWLLEECCRPGELMSVLGQAKLCLAMRLHTLIFAARMAVPTLGLVYDPKVESYLKELALPSAGDVERFEVEQAKECADGLMARYDTVLENLKEKSEELARCAQKNEQLLLTLLEQTKSNET